MFFNRSLIQSRSTFRSYGALEIFSTARSINIPSLTGLTPLRNSCVAKLIRARNYFDVSGRPRKRSSWLDREILPRAMQLRDL